MVMIENVLKFFLRKGYFGYVELGMVFGDFS